LRQKLLKLIYEEVYDVEYSQPDCFAIELSFTILDWTIMERIVDDKTYDFSNVEQEQRLQMCFNVFPKIKSVFHILAINSHVLKLSVLQQVFDDAASGLLTDGKPVLLPIIMDEDMQTPIDICLRDKKNLNVNLAAFLFKNTKDYPMLHSSHLLRASVCKAIEFAVPGIGDFLDARIVTSEHLSSEAMKTNSLNKDRTKTANGFTYVS
jgi:hypothetical protein